MPRRTHTYLPATLDAARALGTQIAIARRELGWTAAELAGRIGVTPTLVARLEKGAPGTALGTALEAAVVCGVPLFGVDTAELPGVADRTRATLALLPQRVRQPKAEISDDF
ncbi:helix-turn-helix transcriptional regulator [Cellulomonas soli]|uniref:Transcriptional regulator n=1 Tax=Cellulomonas soli TaxID=931535 RepID=A0A512PDW5_9CELL|nr:helix-turn-helix transcriptional regulator [Cellulomonas soli]NYI59120.1 transcriptional regulator with XRE-family HTH domain [Cellulomonas soli]GEP69388.1 transcriptional regulator [Cellulomonas soli]